MVGSFRACSVVSGAVAVVGAAAVVGAVTTAGFSAGVYHWCGDAAGSSFG